jgi:hypothetical protein
MKKRFTEGQIAFALRQAINGTQVDEIRRWMSLSRPSTDGSSRLPVRAVLESGKCDSWRKRTAAPLCAVRRTLEVQRVDEGMS